MTNRDASIDWHELAETIAIDPDRGGDQVARHAIAALLGEAAIHGAVDWYLDARPAAEHARSVLSLLRPEAARVRCREIYRTDPDPDRRRTAVELLRVVATADDLPLIEELLTDPDPGVQTWAIGILDRLLFRDAVDAEAARPILRLAEHHPNPQVRDKRAFLVEHLETRPLGCPT